MWHQRYKAPYIAGVEELYAIVFHESDRTLFICITRFLINKHFQFEMVTRHHASHAAGHCDLAR